MKFLTVFYDETCGFCLHCRDWLLSEPQVVSLILIAKSSLSARHPQLAAYAGGSDLVAVSDEGDVWVGDAAFLTILFALESYRGWARRLAGPSLRPYARRFFELVSTHRGLISQMLGGAEGSNLERVLAEASVEECLGSACSPRDGSPRR